MPEGRWTYKMLPAEPRPDDPSQKELRSAVILTPEGHCVLKVEKTRRHVDIEAEEICRLLNITRAHLVEGVMFV